ncbi:hypothetical protein OAF34_04205, partial [Pirellulaceae bacterium]|nr:hypothetical protein [Pirellulaceae bacterium]
MVAKLTSPNRSRCNSTESTNFSIANGGDSRSFSGKAIRATECLKTIQRMSEHLVKDFIAGVPFTFFGFDVPDY